MNPLEKSVAELIDELVEVSYQLDKIKYPNSADRRIGYVQASYLIAYSLDFGYSTDAIKCRLQDAINELLHELSDLSDTVELSNNL